MAKMSVCTKPLMITENGMILPSPPSIDIDNLVSLTQRMSSSKKECQESIAPTSWACSPINCVSSLKSSCRSEAIIYTNYREPRPSKKKAPLFSFMKENAPPLEHKFSRSLEYSNSIVTCKSAACQRPKLDSKKKKAVSFSHPLVTSLVYRPMTRPEEIDALFFHEDDLLDWEDDRISTSPENFEVSLMGSEGYVSIFTEFASFSLDNE